MSYALFAVGLINLRYQSGEENLTSRTLIITGTGIVIFALTYFAPGKKFLSTRIGKVAAWLVAATLFAFVN
jgi:hypothetical protein